ncbi:MAG: hypothetical protein HOV67_32640 [Kribbellaceae bacterium]|nr:hypothetical protein [Kribbellaceae bacterium]
MSDEQQRRVKDPEAEGLPSTADDDSKATEEPDSARAADGPDPVALPGDEPVASVDYGTTAAEAATPEPLDERLAREEPDVRPEDIGRTPASLDTPAAEEAAMHPDEE